MIKLVCFLRRRPGLSREDFHHHWLERHGPLIAEEPTLARHLVRYEQNHRLAQDYEREEPDAPGFDGATVQWLDSMESFTAFVREPAYAEKIAPDEATFLDRSRLVLLFTEDDDVKLDGGAARQVAPVKLLCLLARRAGLEPSAFHEYWGGPHARLFTGTPSLMRHIIAYHQSHRLEKDYERDPGGYDGLAEQWYPSLPDFEAMVREPAYRETVVPDEERFLDRSAMAWLLAGPPDVVLG